VGIQGTKVPTREVESVIDEFDAPQGKIGPPRHPCQGPQQGGLLQAAGPGRYLVLGLPLLQTCLIVQLLDRSDRVLLYSIYLKTFTISVSF
jgi:hypothetical protein